MRWQRTTQRSSCRPVRELGGTIAGRTGEPNDWSHAEHARQFLLVYAIATTLAFALPIFLTPLAWARVMRFKIPSDTDLAVYFGRCLGAIALVLEGVALRAAFTVSGNRVRFPDSHRGIHPHDLGSRVRRLEANPTNDGNSRGRCLGRAPRSRSRFLSSLRLVVMRRQSAFQCR